MLLLLVVLLPSVQAQTSPMTDNQVMEYIIKENDKGTSRDIIVRRLIEKGVPVEQIRRIRDKYEKEQKNTQMGARDITGGGKNLNNRMRNKENGQETPGTYQRKAAKEQQDPRQLTDRQKMLRDEQQFDMYSDAFGNMLPDSLAMYDNIMGNPKAKNEKVIFGRNIFNRQNLTFEPEMNIATPRDYRLGPGDAVYIDVWGASQKTYQGTVSPEGSIDIEGYGPVQVSGMTIEQANRHLKATLGQRYSGSNIRLTVGETRSITVNVMGEVVMPGTYNLSAFATVFHALYMAGGVNDIGTLRNIKVYRNGTLVTKVDVYDYILGGNLTGNVRLASGDVITVDPYECLVNITGKVKRPMYYEMKSTESLSTLINYAGGFTGDAFPEAVRLVRKSGGRYSVYNLDEFERASFQMADGDSVFVDSVLNRYTNMVEIKGAIFRPGMYQMDGSITSVRQLVEKAGGPTEDAFTERIILYRRKEDRTLKAMSINLDGLMNHTVADIALNNEDIIYIPSLQEIRAKRVLKINGEVLYPGEYDYIENLTLEDFILQAGGLTDAASMVKIDVSRRIRNNKATSSGNEVCKMYSFSLVDGFVVEGEPAFVLEPFDEVYVRRSPGYTEQQHVIVEGEVAFAGTYALTKKTYRLSDLIKECGGFNSDAYVAGARLERRLTPAEKVQQESLLMIATNGDSVDVKKLELGDTRYVGINLDKAIANPGSEEWDLVLRDGDHLVIPQFSNTVSISGEVMYPTTVTYKKGARLSYYINKSGGFSLKAKQRRAFVVHMNGTVSRVRSSKDIQPGCEIVVPAKSKRRRITIGEILSMGTMTATLGTVIATLLK